MQTDVHALGIVDVNWDFLTRVQRLAVGGFEVFEIG
jgi:hypothetical protein